MIKHTAVILLALVVSLATLWTFGTTPVEVVQAALPTISGLNLANAPEYEPHNNKMWLTVPAMKRVDHLRVRTGAVHNTDALDKSALHVAFTGFPWQHNKNVYIAGHRLGFKGMDSWKVFADIDKLQLEDQIVLEDSEGKKYYYQVSRQQKINPTQTEVMLPNRGKDTITLQSCTLPDYTRRILVVGERVEGLGRFV